MISFPFMVPGCCFCLVWLLAYCVFLPTALAMKWSRIVKGLVALTAFYFFGATYPYRLNTPTLHCDSLLRTTEALEAVDNLCLCRKVNLLH